MNKRNKPQRRRRTGLGPLQKLITILLISLAAAFGLMIFFNVETIQVEGNNQYSDEEIIATSGVAQGDNLIMINKGKASNLIMGQLNYITDVKLLRVLPDTLVISVIESGAAAYVTDSAGNSWYIDKNGKVLSRAEGNKGIAVTGFTPESGAEGFTLVAGEAEASKLDRLTTLLTALEETGLASKVSAIDLTADYNPIMTYDTRFRVELGAIDNIDYKLQYLVAVAQRLTASQSGTIDLTFETDAVAHFRPDAQ